MLTIYGTSNCGWCKKAVVLAEQYMLQYEYRDCDVDFNKIELKERFPDTKTVPQIWWNGKHIGGYESFAKEIEDTMINYGQGAF
jgi:glutaredoxin 3